MTTPKPRVSKGKKKCSTAVWGKEKAMESGTPDERVTISCIEKGRFARGIGALCIFTALVVVLILADVMVGRKTYVATKGSYAVGMHVL